MRPLPCFLGFLLVAGSAGAQDDTSASRAQVEAGLRARVSANGDDWLGERAERAIQGVFAGWVELLTVAEAEREAEWSAAQGAGVEVSGFLASAPGAEDASFQGGRVTRAKASVSAREYPLPRGVRIALGQLPGERSDLPLERVEFKTTSVVPGDPWVSEHRVASLGRAASERVETHARWRCTWSPPAEEAELPVLRSIEVLGLESAHSPRTLFQDVTGTVFAGVDSFERQLVPSLASWSARIDRAIGPSLIGHEGLALGDANGDGLEDLFVLQPGGLPNRLYLRQADGSVVDGSSAAGLDFLDASRSALFADFDGDGDADLAIEQDPRLLLLENDGEGVFSVRIDLDVGSTTSLAAADVDLDGDLDLYACGYILPDEEHVAPVPYHDANNGRPNTLLLNGSAWNFRDATAELGFDENNRRFSFAACFEDVDDDGDPDLYVANDFGRNNLYVNEGGRFRDRAAEAGVEDLAAGMGVSFADVDRDGDFDLHVSNMFSSAGERVTGDARFGEGRDDDLVAAYRRHARGNSLFLNAGDGTFEDASLESGVTVGRWAWGAVFCELDNDGWPDLFVPNGFVTGTEPDDL